MDFLLYVPIVGQMFTYLFFHSCPLLVFIICVMCVVFYWLFLLCVSYCVLRIEFSYYCFVACCMFVMFAGWCVLLNLWCLFVDLCRLFLLCGITEFCSYWRVLIVSISCYILYSVFYYWAVTDCLCCRCSYCCSFLLVFLLWCLIELSYCVLLLFFSICLFGMTV